MTATEDNKRVVCRFNKEVLEQGLRASFDELVDPAFVNRSAPAGALNGPESLWNTFDKILRPGLQDLTVTILDQIAEGDRVTTRKTVSGVFDGQTILGIAPTGRRVQINVIDIVRVEGGKYAEHWGVNDLVTALKN